MTSAPSPVAVMLRDRLDRVLAARARALAASERRLELELRIKSWHEGFEEGYATAHSLAQDYGVMDLVDQKEIAEMLGVGASTVNMWLKRPTGFPEPWIDKGHHRAKLWDIDQVMLWFEDWKEKRS